MIDAVWCCVGQFLLETGVRLIELTIDQCVKSVLPLPLIALALRLITHSLLRLVWLDTALVTCCVAWECWALSRRRWFHCCLWSLPPLLPLLPLPLWRRRKWWRRANTSFASPLFCLALPKVCIACAVMGWDGMEYILRVYNNIYLRVSVLYDGISNGVKAGSLV